MSSCKVHAQLSMKPFYNLGPILFLEIRKKDHTHKSNTDGWTFANSLDPQLDLPKLLDNKGCV